MFFRARPIVDEPLPDEARRVSNVPSLFVFGQLSLGSGYLEHRRSSRQLAGIISDIGFANGWGEELQGIDNRTYDFSKTMYVYDRFITLAADPSVRSAARITVSEDRVRDDQLRSDIEYSGFGVKVAMREAQFRLVQDHLDWTTEDTDEFTRGHFRRLALRIPTAPFAFPPTRGNADPWSGPNALGRLKTIRRFEVDAIEITLIHPEPLAAVPGQGTIEDRYAAWIGPTLALRRA